ncbi:fluoride efflux transporter CrcB [Lysobacter olei]
MLMPAIWWQQLGLVMLGGALGAAGRHWLAGVLLRHLGSGFPWGTFTVNMLGSFAIGFLAIWLEGRGPSALYWRAFLIVGVLGALTTWSSLMLECLLMARTDRTPMLMGYLLVSLVTGLFLVWLGARVGGAIRPPL